MTRDEIYQQMCDDDVLCEYCDLKDSCSGVHSTSRGVSYPYCADNDIFSHIDIDKYIQAMFDLKMAKCCGSCEHCAEFNNLTQHEPHYSVAKIERWCYLLHLKVARECVCDFYEEIKKGGSKAVYQRIRSFYNRRNRIINVVHELAKRDIQKLNLYNYYSVLVKDGWLYLLREQSTGKDYMRSFNTTDKEFDGYERSIYEKIKEFDEENNNRK